MNRKYLASLALGAALVLAIGIFIRGRLQRAQPSAPAPPSEASALQQLSQDGQLERISDFLATRIAAVAPRVVYIATVGAAGFRFGQGDTLVTTLAGRPVISVAATARDTGRAAPPAIAEPAPNDWLLVVGRTPEGRVVSRREAAAGHPLKRPYVLKPIAEGSSVGVFIVTEQHEHPPQELTREDWAFGEQILVERYIPGKELTCAVIGDRALDVIEIVAATRFYDFEAKYAPGGSKHILPAPILPFVYQEVRRLALKAHHALGCRGVTRADFRYDDQAVGTEGLVCLEVNTQPGMTETSLVPELAIHAGMTFDELVRWMVEDASLSR